MTPLRIALVGPLNETSSIAMNGVAIATELARRGHELTMVRSEVGAAAALAPRAVPFATQMLVDISDEDMSFRFDVVLAQFGDNYLYHGALMNRIQRLPMVGILHDATIPNLVLLWAFDVAESDEIAFRGIAELGAELYGRDATRDISWTDPLSYATEFPMLEHVSRYLDGAVVHANHYRDRVIAATRGPVEIIPLVEDDLLLPETPTARSGQITVGVIGNVNPNKRIDQLLIALGASEKLRKSVQVKVVGHVEPNQANRLSAMANALGVAAPIFTGWVENERLSAELADIDVICCLRFPILEGASGSLVLALRSGRPTLVSRHGSYAETPEDMAMFCEPGNEARDVLVHLESILADPTHGKDMGVRARKWATHRHSVKSYVDRLEPFLHEYSRLRPIADARRAMTDMYAQVGINQRDPAVSRGHAALAQLVGK